MPRAATRTKAMATRFIPGLSQRFKPPACARASGTSTSGVGTALAAVFVLASSSLIGSGSEVPIIDQGLIVGRRVTELHDGEVVEAFDDSVLAALERFLERRACLREFELPRRGYD